MLGAVSLSMPFKAGILDGTSSLYEAKKFFLFIPVLYPFYHTFSHHFQVPTIM